jgi:hypothetical protein
VVKGAVLIMAILMATMIMVIVLVTAAMVIFVREMSGNGTGSCGDSTVHVGGTAYSGHDDGCGSNGAGVLVVIVVGIGLVEMVIMMVYGTGGLVVRLKVCGGHEGTRQLCCFKLPVRAYVCRVTVSNSFSMTHFTHVYSCLKEDSIFSTR